MSGLNTKLLQHARSETGTIKPGTRIGHLVITEVGTHAVAYTTDEGWTGSAQIPFIDPDTGKSLPSHRRALIEAGEDPEDWIKENALAANPTRSVTLRVREGTRVQFRPTPASLALYSSPPAVGATGAVTSVPVGGGKRRTSLPGPGGGLVYVKWDDGSFQGVSSIDLVREGSRLAANPIVVSPVVLAAGGALALGLAWWWLKRRKADDCPVTAEKLYAWNSFNWTLIYLFEKSAPPSLAEMQANWPQAKNPAKLVAVLKDGTFWSYASGKPVAAPELRASYCEYVK